MAFELSSNWASKWKLTIEELLEEKEGEWASIVEI